MGKKLLSVFFLLSIFFLSSFSGFGQACPTSVSISASPGTTICAGTDVTFTANVSGGSGYTYLWQIGGVDQNGETNSTFTTSSLTNGQKVRVVVGSTTEGSTGCSKSSNELTMTVNAIQTPTVSITASKTSFCPGESITFNVSNTSGGTSPQYAWYINSGTSIAKTGASATFSASDFAEGNNTVRVILTGNVSCASSTTAEATSAIFQLKPDATISTPSNKDQTICINTPLQNISFTLDGGATNATVTGLPPGVTGSKSGNSFVLSGSPTTKGTFSYTVTTTGTCAQTTATGTITVNPNATIALTSGNNAQTVCAAGGVSDGNISLITYSIGDTGTGAVASGLPSGITGSYNDGIFTIQGSSSAVGTHSYSVRATGTCGESASLSGSIIITEKKAPSVSIISSDADNTICAGTSVTFTATPTLGGTNPTYQWKIGGTNAGSNSSKFTTTELTDGQAVTVEMSSSETCLTTAIVTSNAITTTVNTNLTPEVTILASDSDICPGDPVTFTATPVNGGASPTYQWKIGNTNVTNNNSAEFRTTALTDGQVVTVTMTSSESCLTTTTATSNSIETNVNPDLIPSVTIISNDSNNIICSGSNISFTATPVNGGGTPSYQWKVGNNNVGTNDPTFNTSSLINGQIVTVVMTASNDICLGQTTSATSNAIPVQVDNSIASETPQWDNSNTSHNPTAICPSVSGLKYKVAPISGATSYDWTLPSGWTITNGAGTNEITVTANVNASAGSVKVKGKTECGQSLETSIAVTTGTAAHVSAGPDQIVCPGTTQITLAGEIGGVITQKKDWNWSDNGAGGSFGNNQGSEIKGTYTIPTSLRNGGTVTITIQSVKPAGNCDIKTDEMTLTIQSAATISDPATKNQTVCINSALTPISFNIGGAGQGATTTGLPAGVTGSFANGIYTLSGTPTQAGTFNYTVTTTGNCVNTSRTGTITVNPRPTFTQPQEVAVCAGSTTPTISFGGSSVTGTTYNWTNDNTSIGLATSGTGNITSFTASNSTNEPLVANISVTPIANNCEGTAQQFKITVYPTATFTAPTDLTVCNGENLQDIIFAGSNVTGTTYKWNNSNTNIGLASEGTGNISSFFAINTTNSPIESTLTVTPVANGCDGTPEEFTITVNPTPAITAPDNIVVCNGEDLPQLDFSGATVTGTSYSWTNNSPSIGLAANGTGSLTSFTAVNNGTEPVNATITVIPAANECQGEPVTFVITVNPTSTVNPIEDVIVCNGEDLSELVLSSTVTGTTYSWTNSNSEIGLTGSGTGNIPAFSAENETEAAITATITIIPTANECAGTPYTFEITVNPSAIVEAGPDQTICSNGMATMAATLQGGATEGTWTTSGSGTFNNNSVNAEYTVSATDVLNGSVTLTYTSNDPEGPCGPSSDFMELFINEEVVITTQPENIGICSTEPSELRVIASGDNLSYEWKRTDQENITNSNGIYSSTLSFNNTTSVNGGEYYVIVRGEEGCTEVESERVTINVDENIIIDEPTAEVPICGDGFSEASMRFIAHAHGVPLTFKWFKDGQPVDASDPKITIEGPTINGDNKYEGTLRIEGVTVDYNGDYYVEITGPEEFTCSTAVTNPFQLRLNAMPVLPAVEDLVVCQNETPEAFTVNLGTDLKWYLNEDDAEYIVNDAGQPTAPVPATDVPGDYFYWVTQQPEACESEKVQVKVTIKEKPAAPTVTYEDAVVKYCLGETGVELTAKGVENATLNWYDSEGEGLSGVPIPNTDTAGDVIYYVSQTPDGGLGCESDRTAITVTVYPLPVVTAEVAEEVICLGTAAQLSATGGVSYLWYDGEEEIGNEASISHTPDAAGDYTFTVLVTDGNGCQNTAEVNVQVDENTVAGNLTAPSSVCINNPGGTLNLSDYTGDIVKWESKATNAQSWSLLNNGSTDPNQSFSGITESTTYRATVKNGVCGEDFVEATVILDPLPEGGKLAFQSIVTSDNDGRIFIICEKNDPGFADPLSLIGKEGQVAAWWYRGANDSSWSVVDNGEGGNFTETTLSGNQIEAILNGNLYNGKLQTTVFRVEVSSGACSPNKFSETGIISVIPNNIEPTPVEIDPEVICFGEDVTLYAETGYENGVNIEEGGMFDNASITNHGWRLRRDGSTTDASFNSSANTTRPDFWLRTNPKSFYTANINSPSSGQDRPFSSDGSNNNPFVIVSGNNPSTLELPVFNLDGTDQAILTFDQAYNLTAGASIRVEISTNGGASYETVPLYEVFGPASSGNFANFGAGPAGINQMQIDLGNYMGRNNLRIRFHFLGGRAGDVWAFDNVNVPDGPKDVVLEWNDNTDPDNPIFIGNSTTETWTPTQIGLNTFVVKTMITTDSNGNQCDVVQHEESVEVFVYDSYTSTPTAAAIACGTNNINLTATVTGGKQGIITEYPTADGYIGYWDVVTSPNGYVYDEAHFSGGIANPTTTFTPDVVGSFSLRWTLELEDETAVSECENVIHEVDLNIFDQYTSTAAAVVGACGDNSIELTGSLSGVLQGVITTLPTPDGTYGEWQVISGPEGYIYSESQFSSSNTSISAVNDPSAIFSPNLVGNYTLRWAIINENNSGCEHSVTDVDVTVYDSYTSTATAALDTCETNSFNLVASVSGALQGVVSSFPTLDGTTGKWEVLESPEGYEFAESHFTGGSSNPNAVFTPVILGEYKLNWTLVNENLATECIIPASVSFKLFDQYTLTAEAEAGSCGDFVVQLIGTTTGVWQENVTYPTQDGYIGQWRVEGGNGTFSNPNPADTLEPINNSNAIFTATDLGNYTFYWELLPDPNFEGEFVENTSCPVIPAQISIEIKECIALDFDGVNDYVDLGDGYTGSYSLEAWILPKEAGGTIISGPNFIVTTPAGVSTSKWTHVAVSNGSLYLDGILQTNVSITGNGGARALIGARWTEDGPTDFFHGWIEEVRIWNGEISQESIRFTMNQRLKPTDNIGVEVDMDHPDSPDYSNLTGYYQLLATEADILPGGLTLDLATTSVNGKLMNMETLQENTAPLPYYTKNDGSWDTVETWARPTVWKIPNTNGVNWNIVRTLHNVNADRDISVLGLISEVNTLTMEGTNPTGWQSGAGGSGNSLTVSHYLRLDGGIDLVGESQLLQPELSIVDTRSSGWLERDQQGTANSFNYNYWSSPVSSEAGNVPYTIKGVMKDGSNSTNGIPVDLGFGTPHTHADGALANPRKISSYWLNLFHGDENVYAQWKKITETTAIPIGEGYTMKGTANVPITDSQNYTFRGIPNNGDVNLSIAAEQSYMIGNPYPSAIEANEFILDNLKDVPNGRNTVNSFNGTLYFWSHFAGGNTHILKEYVGGYAVYNLAGGIKAFANDERINNTGATGGEEPQEFIPVGQSFFINSTSVGEWGNQNNSTNNPPAITGGGIVFRNSQRTDFVTEGDHSVFHKPEIVVKGNKEGKDHSDKRTKFWLKFKSPKGYHREILVAADENTTDGFDLGYDAPMIEYNLEDMFWLIGATELVIQGVPDFDKARVIPMGLVIDGTEAFTIEIAKSVNVPEGMEIYLKDKATDSIHDLRKTGYVSTSEPGYINERFEIVFFKEDPKIEPNPENPGEEIDYGVELSFRHAHVGRELQILNPKQVPINELLLFDMNGKLITTYKNIAHEKEVRLPVKNYSAGVYIAKLYSESTVITKKIIIQN